MNPSITVYEYDKTGLYTGETTAKPSPREEGVWLIPANATPLEPPVTGEHAMRPFSATAAGASATISAARHTGCLTARNTRSRKPA